jgi:hypothetical protein
MAEKEKKIRKKIDTTFQIVEKEFGESAAVLTKTLITAFGRNPGKDKAIAHELQGAVLDKKIFLDETPIIPSFFYIDHEGNKHLLFTVVEGEAQESDVVYYYDEELYHLIRPDPLVQIIINTASDIHDAIEASNGPSYLKVEMDTENGYWAQYDLRLHLIGAAIQTSELFT